MDLVDAEGVTVDADMSSIEDEVEIEVGVQMLPDLFILKLVISEESEVIWPVVVRRLET